MSSLCSKAWYFELSAFDWPVRSSICCLRLSVVSFRRFIAAARISFHVIFWASTPWTWACSWFESATGCSSLRSFGLVVASVTCLWYFVRAALRLNLAETKDWVSKIRISKFVFDLQSTEDVQMKISQQVYPFIICARKIFILAGDPFRCLSLRYCRNENDSSEEPWGC